MSYRINSTGRRRILREYVEIRLVDGAVGQAPSFSADIRIPKELGLDPSARIYVEPYVKSSSMRFDFGTIGEPMAPPSCVLTDIDAGANVLFRIKVVDESNFVGRILASAEGVRPEEETEGDGRRPLLPLRTRDLGEELWQLAIDKDAGASLVVTNKVPGLADRLPSDALLQACIYPEVVRQLVRKIYLDLREVDEEQADWVVDWSNWFAEQTGAPIDRDELREPEDIDALADQVVEAFARRHKFASAVAASFAAWGGQ